MGFWIISPLMYSLAGLVSGNCKNSAKVIGRVSVLIIIFYPCSINTQFSFSATKYQQNMFLVYLHGMIGILR
jgi:hypothetical protein